MLLVGGSGCCHIVASATLSLRVFTVLLYVVVAVSPLWLVWLQFEKVPGKDDFETQPRVVFCSKHVLYKLLL